MYLTRIFQGYALLAPAGHILKCGSEKGGRQEDHASLDQITTIINFQIGCSSVHAVFMMSMKPQLPIHGFVTEDRASQAAACSYLESAHTFQNSPKHHLQNILPMKSSRCRIAQCQNSFFHTNVTDEDSRFPDETVRGLVTRLLRVVTSMSLAPVFIPFP